MASVNCPKCESPLAYQPPVQDLPAPWFFGELSAWLVAALAVAAVSALGFAYYWPAAALGAAAGVLLFVKLTIDTESNPAEGLYFCASCKRYFKGSSIGVANGDRSAI